MNKRKMIFNKYNGKCAYCGSKITIGNFDVEHIKPKTNGGSSHINNLLPSCKTCNGFKASLSIEEFRTKIENLKHNYGVVKLFIKYNSTKKRKVKFYYEMEREAKWSKSKLIKS